MVEITCNENNEAHQLISKMREVDAVQLETLCRMHLSFELDIQNVNYENGLGYQLNSCQTLKAWNKFSRKWKINTKESVTELSEAQLKTFRYLILYLKQEYNLIQEGIFRKSGLISRQNLLKEHLMNDLNVSEIILANYTAHDCASVLKLLLSELKEPLFTMKYYDIFFHVAGK